jgi:lipoprotein-releasing system ATP-binding protein
MAFLSIRNVFKSYFLHGKRIDVLRGVSLDIEKGELVSLIGASGAGKSTFLHVLGTLDMPAAGELRFDGRNVFAMNDAEIADFRNRTIGFVFQSHYLLPEFTALENVAMPGWIGRADREETLYRASELLAELGLAERSRHFPNQLSGGEQQRVAIARALLADPVLFLADEPTGNLDLETSEKVFDLMRQCHNKRGLTSIIVTHNPELAARCDRVFEMPTLSKAEGSSRVEVKQQRHN